VKAQKKKSTYSEAPPDAEISRSTSVASGSPVTATKGASGKFGFVLLGLMLIGVTAWLATRVTTTVTAKKAIEVERRAKPQLADSAVEVTLAPLTRAKWGATAPLEGTVEAKDRAELAFKVGGRLASVNVRVGDRVKVGQLLGRLDSNEAAAQMRAAEAQLDAARAQTVLTEDQGQRTQKLVASGALAEATAVQATQADALSQAQARAAKAQLALAAASVSNHVLVAPFSGVVTRAPTTRGAVVGPGQALFEIVDNSELRLKGTVNEADAVLVAQGAPVTIETDAGVAKGKVRVVVEVLDRVTRRVPVEVDLEPHAALRVGSFVRAVIQSEREVDVIAVPGGALRSGSQDTLMIVVDGRLEERQVRFAVDPKSGTLLVRSGLEGTEQVVLLPRPEAKTGDSVRITGATPAPQGAPVGSPKATPGREAGNSARKE
jgi:RND family efflux transporter MFP subunit